MTPPPGRNAGFALLGVLLTLGAMSVVVTQMLGAARIEAKIAANLRGAAVAEAAADGGVAAAIIALQTQAWPAADASHNLRIGEAQVTVRITDQAGKINPNDQTHPVAPALRDKLIDLGLTPTAARTLAEAIVDWRTSRPTNAEGMSKRAQYRAAGLDYAPSDRPFESLDEIRAVLGMTPEIFAGLAPALSLYAEPAPPNATLAAARYPQANLVAEVTARALAPSGARFVRRAILRLLARPRPGAASFQILTWTTPDAAWPP